MSRVRVHAPQDPVAGASLVAVSLFALWAAAPSDAAGWARQGRASFPRVRRGAPRRAGFSGALASSGGRVAGPLALRGPVLIALSVVAFALTIRVPGLAVAGPAAMLVAGAASPETRWRSWRSSRWR